MCPWNELSGKRGLFRYDRYEKESNDTVFAKTVADTDLYETDMEVQIW